jgi:hypothetical protein
MSRSQVLRNAVELFEATAAHARSPGEIEAFLAFLPGTPRYTLIRVQLLFHEGDLSSLLLQTADRWRGIRVLNPDASAFVLELTYGRKHLRSVQGVFAILPSSADGIHRLVTICASDFWNVAIRRFVNRGYPRLVRPFLKQADLRKALEGLQREIGARGLVIVQEMSMKERRTEDRRGDRAPAYDSDRKWTERAVPDAFDEARERHQWFRSVKFRVERPDPIRGSTHRIVTGRLYKDGQVHFDRSYREFADGLLSVLESGACETMKLFMRRGLRERGYEPARPLEIVYGTDVFDNGTLQRFAENLMRYPHATKAVLHANPYLHVSVADFVDGSSVELWVLSPRRVLLVPQAKASVAALGRLTSYIFSRFREGSVREYSVDA